MEQKQTSDQAVYNVLNDDFEQITRQMRWLAIYTLVLFFPFDPPRTYMAYGLALLAVVYNLMRYSRYFMRRSWFASTMSMLVVDNVFLLLLVALIGDVKTPYLAFMIFTVISAVYRYKTRGLFAVIALQLGGIYTIISHPWFTPLRLNDVQAGFVTAFVLMGIGVFVERLTRIQREEKDKLARLSVALESGRKQLLTLVNSLDDAIFVIDDHGRISDYNAAAEDLCGNPADMKNKPLEKFLELHPHVNFDTKPVDLLKESGPQHRRDLSVTDKGGAVTDLDITVQPVQLEGRNSTSYIIVCKDITKERSLDEQRSEFISVASHELRTPITIMEAALSAALLSKEKMDEQTRTVVEQAHAHCLFLASIVKDLSLLAQASNDNLPIQLGLIDPSRLLHQMAADFKSQATQKGLELDVEIEQGTPTVLSTENHVREILQNYVTNAVKYSETGTIKLKAGRSKREGVIFSVHDTGIGISPSDQKHLFTKFFRSEDYRTRQTNGTGLGLYLCMELAARLNGKVWCESELNKGSTFFLEIPPVSHLRQDQGAVVKAQVANLVEGI